jgi:uncharacterized protein (TIGR01777 family)
MKFDKRILVAGGTGFVGNALRSALVAAGHWVAIATRHPERHRTAQAGVEYVPWLPDLARYDAVVNLAGANLFAKRWSEDFKREIRESRVESTRRVVEAIGAAQRKPAVLVNASAVGIYGDQGGRPLAESAELGADYLADVCQTWERGAARAEEHGVRVVRLRLGVVLGPGGGALAKMLLPFKLGLGGPIGSGAHWMSWIHLDDLCALILHAAAQDSLAGPVNAVAPGVCTNREFTRALGRALHRPTLLPVPVPMLRLAFGEVATVLTSSQRCVPEKALASGFAFRFPTIDAALQDVLR